MRESRQEHETSLMMKNWMTNQLGGKGISSVMFACRSIRPHQEIAKKLHTETGNQFERRCERKRDLLSKRTCGRHNMAWRETSQ